MGSLEHSPARQIVSYFDHEYTEYLSDRKVDNDLNEIVGAGFTDVVVTISEAHLYDRDRFLALKSLIGEMKHRGLGVMGNTWGVGSVCGGEGRSIFKESGEKSCICNPKLDTLFNRWLEIAIEAGVDEVFWDEPEMKCDEHQDDEIKFVEKYSEAAARLGLANTVCLVANRRKAYQLKEAAALPSIDGIANDPYWVPGRGNVWERIEPDGRLGYVEWWIKQTKEAAKSAGKDWHIWVQSFDIPAGRADIVRDHIGLCRKHLADVAIWGFGGCASAPVGRKGPAYETPETIWSVTKTSLRAGEALTGAGRPLNLPLRRLAAESSIRSRVPDLPVG